MTQPGEQGGQQLERYWEVLEQRALVAGSLQEGTLADDNVRQAYQAALELVDERIAAMEARGGRALRENAYDAGMQTAKAIEQLQTLEGILGKHEVNRRIKEHYADRIGRLATFLAEKGDPEDERQAAILAIAASLGVTATDEAAEKPAVLAPADVPVLDRIESQPDQKMTPRHSKATASSQTVRRGSPDKLREQFEADATDVAERLLAFLTDNQGVTTLMPGELWALMSTGQYDQNARRRLTAAVRQVNERYPDTLVHNQNMGKGARYAIRPIAPEAQADESGAPAPEVPGWINEAFSQLDALLIATSLVQAAERLKTAGIKPLASSIRDQLLDGTDEAYEITGGATDAAQQLAERRVRAIAKIGAILEDEERCMACIGSLPESDPRHPLFGYLFDIMQAETYPTLVAIMESTKIATYTGDLRRRGGYHIGGVVRVQFTGQNGEVKVIKPAITKEVPTGQRNRYETAHARQMRICGSVVDGYLEKAGTLDPNKLYTTGALTEVFGQTFRNALGSAREHGSHGRPGRITLEQALVVLLSYNTKTAEFAKRKADAVTKIIHSRLFPSPDA